MTRLALILALVFAVTARAQSSDEWNTPFPPPPPPAAVEEKPATKKKEEPKKTEPVKEAPKKDEKPADPPATQDTFPKAVGEPFKTAPPPTTPDAGFGSEEAADKYKVISQQERYVQERDEHSPSTLHHDVLDKRNLRTTSTSIGSAGMLNVGSADLGPKNLLRLSITGEYFSSSNFPVRNALDVRTAGTFAVAMVPLQFLEVYLAYGASANTNSRSSPALIQALGDVTLGTKLSNQWAKGFYGGLDLRLQSFSGVGSQDVGRWAIGFAPRLVGTYDFRELTTAPLRLHANFGLALDGTGRLVRESALNAAEEYALGINRFHRLTFGAGAEFPLPVATPFVEYGLGYPLGTPANGLASPDGTRVAVGAVMPQALSIGVKVTAVQDVTFLAAADIGLTRSVGLGVPATEPFNLYFGASYNIDPFARRTTKVVETLREKEVKVAAAAPEAPKTFKIKGTVLDAQTRLPLSGVIIAMVGSGLPPVASDADAGRFLTHDVAPGAVKLQATKNGYKVSEAEVTLTPETQPDVQIVLEPDAKPSAMLVTAESTKDKKPIAAKIMVRGAKELMVELSGKPEPARVEVPPGKYTLEVSADGYLSQTRDTQLPDAVEMTVAFQLQPQPKKKLVIVKENRIEILQQVHFATGKATILPDSFQLLDSVVDAIVKSGVKKLRVEGHTDNRGGKAKNLKLSQERAASVADYLIKAGVDPLRIEAVGYGDARPIAPNLTARGRELNRRVEFVITER